MDIAVIDRAERYVTAAFYACGTRVINRPAAWAADVLPRLQQQQLPDWRPQAGVPRADVSVRERQVPLLVLVWAGRNHYEATGLRAALASEA